MISRRALLQSAALAAAVPLAQRAAAAPLSRPVQDPNAQTRLIAGPAQDGVVQAGLEMVLAPGWKTYWRYPGDSGVPPRFDWSGSKNVADVTVLWPAPHVFPDGSGGSSIGYKGRVLLPLVVRLKNPADPAELDLALDFAVCQSLCVPADARLSVPLPGTEAEAPALAEARAEVPVATPFGAGSGPAVLKVERDAGTTPPRLIITARASAEAVLLVEGPDDTWALPIPERQPGAGETVRFTLPLLGVPSDARLPGSKLTLTLVDGAKAIETTTAIPGA
ncbi:protein-disulfide reductase DsbD domain-containing protein [Azorhizobium caulinodans]|uniref:protein-disulfide reductase DsbD domain-containing protein n=3 Tax=Azorhizobium caulinodans TaxID=7 RepID=UPI002FBD4196